MSRSLSRLWSLLDAPARRRAGTLLALMLLAALFESLGVVAVPGFVAAVVDPGRLAELERGGDLTRRLAAMPRERIVAVGSVLLLAVFGLKSAFLVFNARLQTRYVAERRVELARRLVHAYAAAPHAFHLGRNTAELLRNVEKETSIIAYQILGAALEIATRLLILVGVLVPLLILEPLITVAWFALFGGLGAFGAVRFSARLKANGIVEQTERGTVVKSLNEGIGSLKEARVAGRSAWFAERVSASVARMSEAVRFKQFAGAAIPPVTEFAAIAGLLAIVLALLALGRPVEDILVVLTLFAVGLVRLREAVSALMTHLANLRYNVVAVDPVHADLALLERPPPPAAPTLPLTRALRLDGVDFDYVDGRGALRGIDLEIPAGSVTGFVGPTGAGKSTLVDVLLGILEPTAGRLLVDGVDAHRHGVDGWQRNVGYVPQSIYLFDDTLRRNVALGLDDEDIDDARVLGALRAARLGRFVDAQPAGLDTLVGESGARVSGGERQRIGIARALYADPAVLVLDEATSALDADTEAAVIAAVEGLRGTRTIVMIAHRLSTVRRCDALHYLEAGRIEATGSFGELERAHAGFRSMALAG